MTNGLYMISKKKRK